MQSMIIYVRIVKSVLYTPSSFFIARPTGRTKNPREAARVRLLALETGSTCQVLWRKTRSSGSTVNASRKATEAYPTLKCFLFHTFCAMNLPDLSEYDERLWLSQVASLVDTGSSSAPADFSRSRFRKRSMPALDSGSSSHFEMKPPWSESSFSQSSFALPGAPAKSAGPGMPDFGA